MLRPGEFRFSTDTYSVPKKPTPPPPPEPVESPVKPTKENDEQESMGEPQTLKARLFKMWTENTETKSEKVEKEDGKDEMCAAGNSVVKTKVDVESSLAKREVCDSETEQLKAEKMESEGKPSAAHNESKVRREICWIGALCDV